MQANKLRSKSVAIRQRKKERLQEETKPEPKVPLSLIPEELQVCELCGADVLVVPV